MSPAGSSDLPLPHEQKESAVRSRNPRGRLVGVDAARAVALVGMFATHTLPLSDSDGRATLTGLLADGRASALFAVIAGAGVSLSSGGVNRPSGARELLAAGAGLAVRGVLIALLGLGLVALDPPVLVILAYYGLLFVVAIPLVGLRPGTLACAALVACVVTPMVSHVLRTGLPDTVAAQSGLLALADPLALLFTLAVTGFYPVLTWTTYLLVGMAIGRLDLSRDAVAAGLFGGGVVLASLAAGASRALLAVGGSALNPTRLAERFYGTAPTDTWWWLAVDAAHSGTPLDLAHTTGTALAVLGAMLLVARRRPAAVWVPGAVGAVPLTLYVLHAVALTAYPPSGAAAGLLWLHVLGAVLLGVGLRLAHRRGPLEWAVSSCARAVRDAVRRAR